LNNHRSFDAFNINKVINHSLDFNKIKLKYSKKINEYKITYFKTIFSCCLKQNVKKKKNYCDKLIVNFTDISYIIRNLNELNVMKKILFDNDQLILIDYIAKEPFYTDGILTDNIKLKSALDKIEHDNTKKDIRLMQLLGKL
jgi:hypothetical protein